MRQLEQQLLLQQLQQQQQQEQLSATLQSVMSSNANHTPGTSASSSSYKKVDHSFQERIFITNLC